jgi:hypothetical protein
MTQTKPTTPAEHDKRLRDGFRTQHAAPGEARKPIYAEIRVMKRLLARMDKMIEAK